MRLFLALFCLPLLLFLGACGNGGDEFSRNSPVALSTSSVSSFIRNDPKIKWPNPRAVPVCIVNRDEVSNDLFADVMETAKFEYASRAGIGLVGWLPCQPDYYSKEIIRIYFARVHEWSPPAGAGGGVNVAVGKSAADCGPECKGGTMRIQIGKSGAYPDGKPWWVVGATRRAVVHEMGHALGLMHEHERTDSTNCSYTSVKYAAGGNDLYVDVYDSDSIMNFCKTPYTWDLTYSDVRGLQTLYPITADLSNSVSIHSKVSEKCFDIESFTFDPGSPLQQYECREGQRNQLFRLRDLGHGEFEIRSSHNDLCMDVWLSGLENGSPVVQWPCSQTANQRVRLIDRGHDRKSIQFVHSGSCLDVTDDSLANDVKLKQQECTGRPNQSFYFQPF